MADKSYVVNKSKDPITITLSVNGRNERAIVNPGMVALPEGAEVTSTHPRIKVRGGKKQETPVEQVTSRKTITATSGTDEKGAL